jgi:hypothetical protein
MSVYEGTLIVPAEIFAENFRAPRSNAGTGTVPPLPPIAIQKLSISALTLSGSAAWVRAPGSLPG